MTTIKGVTYNEDGSVVSCLFCRICNKTEPADILFSNDDYVVFKNINPVTKNHVLVAPRRHIKNFKDLSGDTGAAVLRDMMEVFRRLYVWSVLISRAHMSIILQVGKIALKTKSDEADNLLQCFHDPPINSIDHLHLHCIQDPQKMSWINYLKYYADSYWCITGETAAHLVAAKAQYDLANSRGSWPVGR